MQVGQQVPSVYVPQMGDEVVYLRIGHQRFLESRNDKRPLPWESLLVSFLRTPHVATSRDECNS